MALWKYLNFTNEPGRCDRLAWIVNYVSYRHHWDWVIQDYKERQLRVQKNWFKKNCHYRINSFIKKVKRLQLKIESLEQFWLRLLMSIYSSEKLRNVYGFYHSYVSQVVSQNSSRSNRWLFFDFSGTLSIRTSKHPLYCNLMKKTLLWLAYV